MEYLVARKFHFTSGFAAQVASYHGTTLEFTELLRATHSGYKKKRQPVAGDVERADELNQFFNGFNTAASAILFSLFLNLRLFDVVRI